MIVIIVLSVALFLFSVAMLIRNEQVYRYKSKLLKDVSRAAQRDICFNRCWQWRYDELHKVSYDTMVKKFWKPLSSFYKDKAFTQL